MDRIVYRQGPDLLREIHSTQVPDCTVAVWNLGQAGFVVKGSGNPDEWIVFDPYLTSAIEQNNPGTEFQREYQPPLEPRDLVTATAVLVTHHHDDHLDPETLQALDRYSTQVVVPAPHVSMLHGRVSQEQVIAAKAGSPISIGSFRIEPVAAAHSAYETNENGDHVYLGYFVTVDGVRLFHSGDTVVTPELAEAVAAFAPHVAFLPINGGDYERTRRGIVGNMGFREAADLAVAASVDMLIPVHYDMFPNNRDNPAYFVDYLFANYRRQKFHMMAVGERFLYMV